ncbi:MAG: histidinol-phosphatase [Phycisphaerae bacterium]|nr:histidinol-phosphatase [Phycisphaerae bacterium]
MNNTLRIALIPCLGVLLAGCNQHSWHKGNTHTHTYWSDGDAAPDQIVAWYVDHDYDFLVLSDHNIMQEGERWHPIRETGSLPLKQEHVDQIEERFGPGWVEVRERDGVREMRLKDLEELQAFCAAEGMTLIPGEEVTDRWKKHEVHINAINNKGLIPPQRGDSVQDTIQRNLDAIIANGREYNRPVMAHINHPNYVWSLTADNLADIHGEHFFEVYNGHRSVNNHGDDTHPSTDEMWDEALVKRLAHGAGDGETLYALATDDAHNHHGTNLQSIPGRGWVMVRAATCTPEDLIPAMKRGDFYASSGVELEDITSNGRTIRLKIIQQPDATYTTEFIGVRKTDDGWTSPAVLQTATGTSASYRFVGDELYVRPRVTSSLTHPRPYQEGDLQMAWGQPQQPAGAR